MLYSDLTEKIIGCAFDVQNELGVGFLESVYEKAMVVALSEAQVPARSQVPINVNFRGTSVGLFYADLLVAERVIVELKTVSQISQQHRAQLINYLNATGIPVGLLINFRTAHQLWEREARIPTVNGKQQQKRTAAK